jgi:two-component system LytT family response regulator
MDKPITTLIVDDEQACIKTLCADLKQYSEIEIIETLTSTEKAKKAILKQQPQLLFLDVEMPKMNGLELLKEISSLLHSDMCVVFYSAFDKYMIDALRVSAFDFLQKPYLPEELQQIIERVKEKINIPSQEINLEQSISRLISGDRKFAIQTIKGLLILHHSQVHYFQYFKDCRCWQIILTNGKTIRLRVNTTAKEILNINASFFQVRQEYIINIDYLASIENGSHRCIFYPPYHTVDIKITLPYYSKLKDALAII